MPMTPPGGVLSRVLYLSLDPYMRGRTDDAKSNAKPVRIGKAMTGAGIAGVTEPYHSGYTFYTMGLTIHRFFDFTPMLAAGGHLIAP